MKSDYQKLFFEVVRALTFEDLRLKPRERLLVLILAIESFGAGLEFGVLHISAWRARLESWRLNELWKMLSDFERRAWIAVDMVEGTYRLAPDRLPGWPDVAKRKFHEAQMPLPTADDLKKMFAKISQDAACENFAALASNTASLRMPPDTPKIPVFSGVSLRSLCGLDSAMGQSASPLKVLKDHKGYKLLQDLTALKARLLLIESGPEQNAYEAMRDIVGFDVMEGGDLDANDQPRIGDGGKWRNRWRTNRAKVHRVFAALVEELQRTVPIRSRGATVEKFWQEFGGSPAGHSQRKVNR